MSNIESKMLDFVASEQQELRDESREEGAGDLVQLMGGLLCVAANLCRDSLTMTRARFTHAPRLAWAWDAQWPCVIEAVEALPIG